MSRDAILARVRAALAEREPADHPGGFEAWGREAFDDPVEAFGRMFEAAGGEVVRVGTWAEARAWLADTSAGVEGVTLGDTVPPDLRPDVAAVPAEDAELGISMARAAIAEVGSLVLDSRDGRRSQLLPPRHVVLVEASSVQASMVSALARVAGDAASAIGLHSGPSKSADIGQILVKGVHGPGHVTAVIVEEARG